MPFVHAWTTCAANLHQNRFIRVFLNIVFASSVPNEWMKGRTADWEHNTSSSSSSSSSACLCSWGAGRRQNHLNSTWCRKYRIITSFLVCTTLRSLSALHCSEAVTLLQLFSWNFIDNKSLPYHPTTCRTLQWGAGQGLLSGSPGITSCYF